MPHFFMMLIMPTATMRYAYPDPSKPQVQCYMNKMIEVDDYMGKRILQLGGGYIIDAMDYLRQNKLTIESKEERLLYKYVDERKANHANNKGRGRPPKRNVNASKTTTKKGV